jgi:hypothetical protein
VKYADDLVLLGKEEKVLQDMSHKLIEIGRCYGMEKNVEKTKIMRISRQPFPVKIMIDKKQLENVESFTYFGSILTNDVRCTCEIMIQYKKSPITELQGKLPCSEKPSRNSCHKSNTPNPNLPSHSVNTDFCIIFKSVWGSSQYTE